MLELDVIIAVWARRGLEKKMGRKMGGATCNMRQAKERVILDYF